MTTTTEQPPINREGVTTLRQAFEVLGLQRGVSTFEEINSAFRQCVKHATDGHGNYRGDMDRLTQAKDFLSAALTKALDQARSDQARQRAQRQEQEECQAQARQQQQKKEGSAQVPRASQQRERAAHLLGAGRAKDWEALRHYEHAQEQKREDARRLWSTQVSQQQEQARRQQRIEQAKIAHRRQRKKEGEEKAMQQPVYRENEQSQQVESARIDEDPIQSALTLLQWRRSELQQTCQREDELRVQLGILQEQRSQLEQRMQTADALALQISTLLLLPNDNASSEHIESQQPQQQ